MAAYECLLVLMSAQKSPWALIIAHVCSWHHTHACSRLLMSIHEFSWALISSHEHSWALCCSAMAPTALVNVHERSWVWRHGAMITHNALAQYLSVLMSAHKCSWVLLSDPEYSWVILSVQVVDSVINKKCWFLEWLPSSILAISWSRFQQLITNWIVLKSTWKGLWKNVQDGISRCFGGREINKTKVGTILWDTLYLLINW